MTFTPYRVVVFLGLTLSISGCETSQPGPSYADLVVIYNSEVEALDRLESKRETLLEKIETVTHPPAPDNTADVLKGILESAEDLNQKRDAELSADPNVLLDQALENADQAKSLAAQVLEEATRPSEQEATVDNEELTSLQAELGQLDQAIAEQKDRVERARKNRDAAE